MKPSKLNRQFEVTVKKGRGGCGRRYFNLSLPLLSFFLVILCFSTVYTLDVYFSPNGGCQERIIREIDKAQNYINIAMYSFTARPIAQALVRARKRGVKIKILLDRFQAKGKYSKSRYFEKRGFDVKIISGVGRGLMHNKFAVIDGLLVITGSYNWTASAEHRNDENMLVIYDDNVVKAFERRFLKLWEKGT